MNFKCLFGHKWNGCKCEICGKTQDKSHKWVVLNSECIEKCSLCGKERNIGHKWNGCKCEICDAIRDKGHKWAGYKCVRCGVPDTSRIIQTFTPKLLQAVEMDCSTTVTEIGKELYKLGGNSLRKDVARQIGELKASYLGRLGYFIQY
jgi:hypothetical protein